MRNEAWLKARKLQQIMEEMLLADSNVTNEEIARRAYSRMTADERTQAIGYAVSRLRSNVNEKINRMAYEERQVKLETIKTENHKKAKEEYTKNVERLKNSKKESEKLVEEGRRRFYATVMSMTGAQVRKIAGANASGAFDRVKDNQQVGTVLSFDEVAKALGS